MQWLSSNFKSNTTILKSNFSPHIFQILYRILKAGREVFFIWVPTHTGVEGNEEADYCTKNAAHGEE